MTSDERIDRLEQVVQVIAEDQLGLQKLVAQLATETRKGFDRVAEQFMAADRRMTRIEEQMSKAEARMSKIEDQMGKAEARMTRAEERMSKTDERIEKLVIGIGELIQRQRPN
jgi:chromosome segregation ATPase